MAVAPVLATDIFSGEKLVRIVNTSEFPNLKYVNSISLIFVVLATFLGFRDALFSGATDINVSILLMS